MSRRESQEKFDFIVIGLGAHGSSILYELAKQTRKFEKQSSILGIDQYDIPHSLGSSHGDSRLYRMAHPAEMPYVKMARRGRILLRELEKEVNETLHHQVGGLTISGDEEKSLVNLLNACAKNQNIAHEKLDASKLKDSYDFIQFAKKDVGFLEKETAVFFPEKVLKARLEQARKYGAHVKFQEKFLSYKKDNKGYYSVTTDKGEYFARNIFLATGAWLPQQEKILSEEVDVYKATIHWFDVEKSAQEKYKLGNFPITLRLCDGGRSVIVFPILPDSNQVKVFYFGDPEPVSRQLKMADIDRSVSKGETEAFYKTHLKDKFVGITPNASDSCTCLYTKSQSNRFIIQPLYEDVNVIIVSACLRQGFKYSFSIGEALAEYGLTNGFKNTFDVFREFPLKKEMHSKNPYRLMSGKAKTEAEEGFVQVGKLDLKK